MVKRRKSKVNLGIFSMLVGLILRLIFVNYKEIFIIFSYVHSKKSIFILQPIV